jgi:hypothetical protein
LALLLLQRQQPLVLVFTLVKTKGGIGANPLVGSASFPAAAAEQGKPKAKGLLRPKGFSLPSCYILLIRRWRTLKVE